MFTLFSYYPVSFSAVLLKGYLFAKNHFKFFPAFPFSDAVKKENSAKFEGINDRMARKSVVSSGTNDRMAQKSVVSSGTNDRMAQKSVSSFGTNDRMVHHPVVCTSIFSLLFHQKTAF